MAASLLAGLALAGCSSNSTATSASTTDPAGATIAAGGLPIASSLAPATSSGDAGSARAGPTWAVLPMGRLDDENNTFWQLFRLARPGGKWQLATPPGVAANGGLFASSSSTPSIAAGFGVSAQLKFSPLARSSTAGRRWSQEILPAALEAVPDAIALGPDGGLDAIVGRSGATLLSSTPSGGWRTTATATSLAAAGSCRATAITAVAPAGSLPPVIGTSCEGSSEVGLFVRGPGASTWSHVDIELPGNATQATTVVAMTASPQGKVAVLVEATGSSRRLYRVDYRPARHGAAPTQQVSSSVALAAGDGLVAVGTTGAGGLFAVIGNGSNERGEVFGHSSVTELPPLPPRHPHAGLPVRRRSRRAGHGCVPAHRVPPRVGSVGRRPDEPHPDSVRFIVMDCAMVQESISATIDGEDSPIPRAALDGHLATCARCRPFAARACDLSKRLRLTTAEAIPDLSSGILAALLVESPGRRRRRVLVPSAIRAPRPRRASQWAAAVVPLGLAVPALAHGLFTHPAVDPSHLATPCTAALSHLHAHVRALVGHGLR